MKKRYILILIAAAYMASVSNAEWLTSLFVFIIIAAFIIYIATNVTWKTNEQKTTSEDKSIQQS